MAYSEGDIPELLRQHGKEAIFALAESAGLRKGNRLRCPFKGCNDQKDRPDNVYVYAAGNGVFKVKCYRCGGGGDLLDLLEAVHSWSKAEAIAHLRGVKLAPRPALRVVPDPRLDAPDKLKPAEVRRLWDSLAVDDELGRGYLEGRGIEASPFVRFATDASKEKLVRPHPSNGRRVAMLLSDVVGNPRGIQVRLAREAKAKESKQKYVTGSNGRGAFFGQPELIEAAPLVLVAEGMCDTLALFQWAGGAGVVVGAPGKGALASLAEELKASGIPVDGKVFVLFPQNDRPKNESRREFVRLAQLLSAEGAHPVLCATPAEWKDVAAWRCGQSDVEWPPAELARALGQPDEPGADAELVRPSGAAIAVPLHFTSERYGQDLSTLLTLLDDPVHREAIMGHGELRLSDMAGEVYLGEKPFGRGDVTAVRYGLEQQGRSLEGKPLKFGKKEVEEALFLLASRRHFHPLTQWASGLKWTGKQLLDVELPVAFGQEPGGFTALLLRKWFMGAAARALQPGCKMDTMLVLVGPQGAGKSRFCRALGGPYFTDAKVDPDDDNGKRVMRGAWIIEWGELSSFRRARSLEEIKEHLSKQDDSYRPLYVEEMLKAPRHCAFCGTTNTREYWSDPSGARRFFTVEVTSIDVAWVQLHREQLVAEAVAAVRSGEQHWLTKAQEEQLVEHNAAYQIEDDWEHLVDEWLADHPQWCETTTAQVLENVIKKPAGQWTAADHNRVGAVLHGKKWRLSRPRTEDGGRARVWLRNR